jgi:hypothetical protein
LFTQPCCHTINFNEKAEVETANAMLAGRLLLVGLVDASKFRSHVREIPPTLVLACVAAILLALSAWPLLKIRLISEQQRVRRRDVAAVVACGACGLALLTIVFLDTYAYRWLRHVRDRQLEAFSESLSDRVKEQLHAASEQLVCLKEAAEKPVDTPTDPGETLLTVLESSARACRSSPFFSTFSLIDWQGAQQLKWSAQAWGPAPINVGTRSYFQTARDRIANKGPECSGDACVVESIWSWTTMQPEAVLSIATGRNDLPVAALASPMTALIDPVTPSDFEFAVVDVDGRVLFHSDERRNTFENLFSETDGSPRLRAAIAGHSEGTFSMSYSGRSYRARIRPVGAENWFVVTMQGDDAIWGLHTEWLVLWLAMLLAHMVVFTALFSLLLWRLDSDWLWWNPRRVRTYRRLAWGLLLLLAAAGPVAWRAGDTGLILFGLAITPAAWLASYIVLKRPVSGSAPVRARLSSYTVLAMLLFVLTAIVPAAIFFVAAYHVQVRTYVKSTQFDLAQDIRTHRERLLKAFLPWPGLTDYEVRGRAAVHARQDVRFLFATRRIAVKDGCQGQSDNFGHLEWFVDEFVPYYSEHSVRMRQLLHDRASDSTWHWTRDGATLTLCLQEANGQPAIALASTTPNLLDALQHDEQVQARESGITERIDWLAMAGTALLGPIVLVGLTWAFVWFIKTRICLIDVEHPFWSRARLPAFASDNLFVICDEVDRTRLAGGARQLSMRALRTSSTPDQAWARDVACLNMDQPGQPIVLPDFDLADPLSAHRELAWVEGLVADRTRNVIVLSPAPPAALEQALRRFRPGSSDLIARWKTFLSSFIVVDWRREAPSTDRSQEAASVVATLRDEKRADGFVQSICRSIEYRLNENRRKQDRRSPQRRHLKRPEGERRNAERRQFDAFRLTPEQTLDEIADRAAAWYAWLWSRCTADEKLVLADIAQDGFVNYRKRHTVRRLLGRGLIAKDPSFRVMSETFRRFVRSPSARADVRAIEGAAAPSAWDELRIPLFLLLVGAGLFFVSTQRELFNATVAALTALTGAIPVLVRAVGMVGGRVDGADKKT